MGGYDQHAGEMDEAGSAMGTGHGSGRGPVLGKASEVGEDAQADGLALLGMELAREKRWLSVAMLETKGVPWEVTVATADSSAGAA